MKRHRSAALLWLVLLALLATPSAAFRRVPLGNEDINFETNEDTPLTVEAGPLANHMAAVTGVPANELRFDMHVAPASGNVILEPSGAFAYTPNRDFSGSDVFKVKTYSVLDNNKSNPWHLNVNIKIWPANDAPVVGDVMLPNVNEDETLTFALSALLAHASDVEGDSLLVTAVSSPTVNGGSVTIVGGTGTYTPARSWSGADAFTFTVSDGQAKTTATARLTVVALNDAPVAGDVLLPGTNEDVPLAFTAAQLLANTVDADGDALIIASVAAASAAGGSIAWNAAARSGLYTPPALYHGADSWTFTVSDGHGGTATGKATVVVGSVNSVPVVGEVTLADTDEDTSAAFSAADLLSATTDDDGDTVTLVAVAAASTGGGTVTYNADADKGTYTPLADWSGTDAFTFTVSDGNGGIATGTAKITVKPVRDAPVVADVDLAEATEDTPLTFTEADLLAGATDVDGGETLAVESVAAASVHLGSVTYDAVAKMGTYTPPLDFNGDDAFTFSVTDGGGAPVSAAARVHVAPAGDAPHAEAADFAAREDAPLTLSEAKLLEAVHDADPGETFTIESVDAESLHKAALTRDLGAKTVTYTPLADFHGDDEFGFVVKDGSGATAAAKVTLHVASVNDLPIVVNPAAFKTDEDTPLRVAVADLLSGASDVDGDVLTVSAVASPTAKGGTVAVDGSFVDYAPAFDFNGEDTFTFTVSDGAGGTATGTATVVVAPVNDAATLAVVAFTVPKNTYLELGADEGVLAGMKDVDGDALTVSTSEPTTKAGGRATIEPDGALVYVPPFGYTGTDEATFSFTDGSLETPMVAQITVSADKAPLVKLGLADATASLRRSGAACALRALTLRATVSAGRLRMLKKVGGTPAPTDFGAPNGLELQIARATAPWPPAGAAGGGARGATYCAAAFTRKMRSGESSMQTFESAALARCLSKKLQFACGGGAGGGAAPAALKLRTRARAPKGAAYAPGEWSGDLEFVPACGPCA